MSFLEHMRREVGDTDPTWRYLTEKIAHTALIAWVLVLVGGLSPLVASAIAAAGYLIVGKILWLATTHESISMHVELLDTLFDALIGGVVCLVALTPVLGGALTLAALALWCVLVAAGSNNNWGRPG